MGEETIKQNKIMTAIETLTMRDLVDYANEHNVLREDIVSILPAKEGYIMVFYYNYD